MKNDLPKYVLVFTRGGRTTYRYYQSQNEMDLEAMLDQGYKLKAGYRGTWKKFPV